MHFAGYERTYILWCKNWTILEPVTTLQFCRLPNVNVCKSRTSCGETHDGKTTGFTSLPSVDINLFFPCISYPCFPMTCWVLLRVSGFGDACATIFTPSAKGAHNLAAHGSHKFDFWNGNHHAVNLKKFLTCLKNERVCEESFCMFFAMLRRSLLHLFERFRFKIPSLSKTIISKLQDTGIISCFAIRSWQFLCRILRGMACQSSYPIAGYSHASCCFVLCGSRINHLDFGLFWCPACAKTRLPDANTECLY